jgi:hypothetical protein
MLYGWFYRFFLGLFLCYVMQNCKIYTHKTNFCAIFWSQYIIFPENESLLVPFRKMIFCFLSINA